jgi:SNF2 family DNA or RNA helicase
MLDEILEGNQQDNTLIVYNFVEELAQLKTRYPHLWTLDDGRETIPKWNEGKIRLLAIHPKSAQFGLNLQYGGCKMIFLTLPWSFTDYEQVIGRLHRSGQTRDVWVYLLITNNTIDDKILTALRDKRALSEVAMDELRCTI